MFIFDALIHIVIVTAEIVGVSIAAWGIFLALINFVRFEFLTDKKHREHSLESLRVKFGQKILIALEFFVAGDLVKSVTSPTIDDLTQLGAFVVIRTLLSFFLNREIREIRERHWKTPAIHSEEGKQKGKSFWSWDD